MFKIPTVNDQIPDGWTQSRANEVIAKSVHDPSSLNEEEYEWIKSIVPEQVNPCGDCNVCCITPAIEDEKIDGEILTQPKAACDECENLKSGKCSVYQKRPDICRNYLCAYAMGSIDIHPMENKCAWSFQVTPDGQGLLVGHAQNIEDVLSSEKIVMMISDVCETGQFYAVTVRDSQKAISIHCQSYEAEIAQIDQTDPIKQALLFSSIRSLGAGIPFIQK